MGNRPAETTCSAGERGLPSSPQPAAHPGMDLDRQDSRGRRGGSSPPSVTVLTSAGVDGPRSSHPPGRGAPSAWDRAGPGGLGPAAPCPACSAEPPGPRVAASLRHARMENEGFGRE
ncbi:uncharacterized protein WM294_012839 [Sarcoramphus papa]